MNDLYERYNDKYMALSRDAEKEEKEMISEARQCFIKRYKRAPKKVIIPSSGPIIYVGPVC